MTDFCHIVSISFNSPLRFTQLSKCHRHFCYSPLRFTPLSKCHRHFFIFGRLEVSLFCHRNLALPESLLDFLSVLLRFNLFETVKNQSYIKLEPCYCYRYRLLLTMQHAALLLLSSRLFLTLFLRFLGQFLEKKDFFHHVCTFVSGVFSVRFDTKS